MTSTTKNTLKNVFTTAFAATFLLAATFLTTPSYGQSKDVRYDDRGPTFSNAKGSSRIAEKQPQISHRVPASSQSRTGKDQLQKQVPQSSLGGLTFTDAKGKSRAAQRQPQSQTGGPTYRQPKNSARAAESQPQAQLGGNGFSTAKGKSRAAQRQPQSQTGGPTYRQPKNSARAAESQPQAQLGGNGFSTAKGKSRAAQRQPQSQTGGPTYRQPKNSARAAASQPQAQLGGNGFSTAKGKSRAAQRQPQSQTGGPTYRQPKNSARAAESQPQAQLGGNGFSTAKGKSRAAQRQPQSQTGGPTYRQPTYSARAAQSKQQKPTHREDSQPAIQASATAAKPIWNIGGLIKGFCGTNESKTNGKTNRYDRAANHELSATAQKLRVSGTAQLDMPGNCLNGDAVEYTFTSDDSAFGFQTGSSMPTSEPVIDESNPRMVIWTFDAAQGPNPYFDNEELHVIHSKNGLLFCTWNAKCRIEVDLAADGEVTQIWNGQFQIVGGTGDYRFATGSWDFSMMTEPNDGELSENAFFEFAGSIDMPVRFDHTSDNTNDGKTHWEE